MPGRIELRHPAHQNQNAATRGSLDVGRLDLGDALTSKAKHMRTETRDIAEATRFLEEFLAGAETWRRRHVWQPLTPQ
jgi:hypothetical protein